jgi:hypothetical protein
MKEFLLDAPVTDGFFAYLRNFGKVESLPDVGEGFYTFEKPDWFAIKGFSGDTTVEVRFKKEVMDLTVDFVYLLFSAYKGEGEEIDLSVLKRREEAIGERVRKRLHGA